MVNNIFNSKLAVFILLVILGFCIYSPGLDAPFKIMDDQISIVNNPLIKDVAQIRNIFTQSFFDKGHYYRPLVSLSYLIEYHFFGLNSYFYNLTNLLLHLSSSFLVFLLVGKISQDYKLGFMTALLFCIHPIQWEAISNISGRSILFSGFFALVSFFLFLKSREGGYKSLIYVFFSLLGFLCSILAKESGVMLPVLLMSYVWLLEKKRRERWIMLFPFVFLVGIYLVLRYQFNISERFQWNSNREMILGFFTFLRGCLTYLRLIIVPTDLHFDRSITMFPNFAQWSIGIVLTIYSSVLIFLIKRRKNLSKITLFFLLWIGLELFPVSQVVATIGVHPGQISLAEHFLYMPSIGIFVFMSMGILWLLEKIKKRGQFLQVLTALFLMGMMVFFVMMGVRQSRVSRQAITMLIQSVRINPVNARVQALLGYEYAIRKEYEKARFHFEQALIYDPNQAFARIGLGAALCDLNRCFESIEEYEKVQNPGLLEGLLRRNLKESYGIVEQQYKKNILDEPDNARWYYSLGVLYSREGRIRESIELYKQTLLIDPEHENAHKNLEVSLKILSNQTKKY